MPQARSAAHTFAQQVLAYETTQGMPAEPSAGAVGTDHASAPGEGNGGRPPVAGEPPR